MAENPRIEELRRRVLADPASIAFAALAEEFRRIGENEQAVETCRQGLLRHPAYLSARVTLGRALIETGDYEAAREELETVLRSAPENLAAIRGLAQIHERLGHSAEMDPHLAEMMNTMHAESVRAESIRVASQPPPEPPPAAPEPVSFEPVSFAREPEPEPEAEPEPVVSLSFAREPEPEAPAEMSLSLAREPGPQPEREPEPGPVLAADVPADPFAAFAPIDRPELVHDFAFDLGAAPSLDLPIAPVDDRLALEPESEPEPEVLVHVAGPDPEVLATLARLERFLDAIHSLRA